MSSEAGASKLRWGWVAVTYNIRSGFWLTPAEAARMLGISPNTLCRWADSGMVTSLRPFPASHRRYLQPEIEEVLRICKERRPLRQELQRHMDELAGGGL